ncbi:hypothetical protein KEM55_000681, partial [Ascosphaera atra]
MVVQKVADVETKALRADAASDAPLGSGSGSTAFLLGEEGTNADAQSTLGIQTSVHLDQERSREGDQNVIMRDAQEEQSGSSSAPVPSAATVTSAASTAHGRPQTFHAQTAVESTAPFEARFQQQPSAASIATSAAPASLAANNGVPRPVLSRSAPETHRSRSHHMHTRMHLLMRRTPMLLPLPLMATSTSTLS